MARTESISIQSHPSDEQAQINLMQRFHWNLLSTQEIKTVDKHLERRGDKIYQITDSEKYVKLAFTRDIDLPNLNNIRKLEQEYFSLPVPNHPRAMSVLILIGCAVVLGAFGALTNNVTVGFIAAIAAYVAFYYWMYLPKKKAADEIAMQVANRRSEIMQELEQYG